MQVFYSLLISTIAGLSTLFGGLVIFFSIPKSHVNRFITFCLSFSLAIMIGISITDLIPTSLFIILYKVSLPLNIIVIILSLFIGGLLSFYLSKLINDNTDSLYKLGILSMLALLLHNLPEGIATFLGSMQDIHLGIKLALAIIFHNIPEGIAIAVPIYYSTKSKKKALLHTFLSGLAEPFGALLAFIFLKNYINDIMISIVLLFVAGIMITLSIEEMLPQSISYKENKYIYLGILVGIILIIFNLLIF